MKSGCDFATGIGVAALTASLACWYSQIVLFLRTDCGLTGCACRSLLFALAKLCLLSSWIVGYCGGGVLLLVTLW